jgi:hypothetical protein
MLDAVYAEMRALDRASGGPVRDPQNQAELAQETTFSA